MRAAFHKNQRVFVKPVGTWALVERVVPQWAKGLEEPIRIFYDVGLGRDFSVDELHSDAPSERTIDERGEEWRIIRTRNKWQSPEEARDHPYPGTYPVIVTGENDWGGWRVPGAEYALSPTRIETQARIITLAPRMAALLKHLVQFARAMPGQTPPELRELTEQSVAIVNYLEDLSK